jgi:septal ring factor EnvC (AmiA/AmiB activator)
MAMRKTAVKSYKLHTLQGLTSDIDRLKNLIARQDDQLDQLSDDLKDSKEQAEFCRKQINHYLALVNILTRGT